MKYAIISDIHANLAALQAVLADAQPHAEAFVCLGDIVGYNANPNECLQLVHDRCEVAIVGNHDQAAIGSRRYDDFTPDAQAAINWTTQQLTGAGKAYLRSLPPTAPFGPRALAAHGSPRHTDEYLHHAGAIAQSFVYLRCTRPEILCCFVGHTHTPMIWQCTPEEVVSRVQVASPRVTLDSAYCYIINPGSVGQPRNGNPAASYLVLDDEALTVTFRAVPYDILATQDKMYDAMLPLPLAERLALGR